MRKYILMLLLGLVFATAGFSERRWREGCGFKPYENIGYMLSKERYPSTWEQIQKEIQWRKRMWGELRKGYEAEVETIDKQIRREEIVKYKDTFYVQTCYEDDCRVALVWYDEDVKIHAFFFGKRL